MYLIDKYPKRLEVSHPGTLRMSKSVAIAGDTSDALVPSQQLNERTASLSSKGCLTPATS